MFERSSDSPVTIFARLFRKLKLRSRQRFKSDELAKPPVQQTATDESALIAIEPRSVEAKANKAKSFEILHLPFELQLTVIEHVDFGTLLTLRRTNSHFRKAIQAYFPQTLKRLLAYETTQWAVERGAFACSYCLRLRDLNKFAFKMVIGGRRRGGPNAAGRFCIECGLTAIWKDPRARGYTRGNQVRVESKDWRVCKNCGMFKPVADESLDRRNCPRYHHADRKRLDHSDDLASWRKGLKEAIKVDTGQKNTRPFLAHGLPHGCL